MIKSTSYSNYKTNSAQSTARLSQNDVSQLNLTDCVQLTLCRLHNFYDYSKTFFYCFRFFASQTKKHNSFCCLCCFNTTKKAKFIVKKSKRRKFLDKKKPNSC